MRRKVGGTSFWLLALVLMLALGTVTSAEDGSVTQPTTPPASNQPNGIESEPEEIPSLTESVLPSLSRIAVSLLVIVVIIYLTVFLLKKLSGNRIGGRKGKAIQIIEQTYLAPKKSVCLLKLADRAILVSVTEQNINLLTEFDGEALPEPETDQVKRLQNNFPAFLNEAAGKLFGARGRKGRERESAV